jgi:hypothetical protein
MSAFVRTGLVNNCSMILSQVVLAPQVCTSRFFT